ncbi:hypothetical protein FIU94_15760 [Sulfitobacter sp. THAF37]|nr:hypothetical protein FIU94_15760 [Sulfitobacter sp. THAF37]
MITFLEGIFARFFGIREVMPARVRANRPHPQQRQLRGRK